MHLSRRNVLHGSLLLSSALVHELTRPAGLFDISQALASESSGPDGLRFTKPDQADIFAGARHETLHSEADSAEALFAGQNLKGRYSAALFTASGDLRSVTLPGRGHDVAVRPHIGGGDGSVEVVAFARRPGRFAVAFSANLKKPAVTFHAADNRHFYGHGVFSPLGQLLYSTENDYENGVGVIGIRNATDGYKQIGEFSSHGIGPHDMALLDDGMTLVIANGGIETSPDSGRQILNLAHMEPSLVYIDRRDGTLLEKVSLPDEIRQLSIRHLTVAGKNRVVFGCQYKGASSEKPMLIGFHDRGAEIKFSAAPDAIHRRMNNYVGSVAVDHTGEIIAASCPRGNLITFWNANDQSYIGARQMKDGCGVAKTSQPNEFLMTSGHGDVARAKIADARQDNSIADDLDPAQTRHQVNVQWDNHAVKVR